MRFMFKFEMPTESSNDALRDPKFGEKMRDLLKEIKAESAYFTTVNGHRGGYIFVDLKDASEIPALAEPFFLWFGARIELIPVMTAEDLGKAGPAIGKAVEKWG